MDLIARVVGESVNIHTVSASSIGDVVVSEGHERPVEITVQMTNSAGVFQVQEILYRKLRAGVAGEYIEIDAVTIPESIAKEEKRDERIVHRVLVIGDKLCTSVLFKDTWGIQKPKRFMTYVKQQRLAKSTKSKMGIKYFLNLWKRLKKQ